MTRDNTNDPTHPGHYDGDGVTTCEVALDSMMTERDGRHIQPRVASWWGLAFKYLWRWPWKNGVEDLNKAKVCIDKMIARLTGEAAPDCSHSTE